MDSLLSFANFNPLNADRVLANPGRPYYPLLNYSGRRTFSLELHKAVHIFSHWQLIDFTAGKPDDDVDVS